MAIVKFKRLKNVEKLEVLIKKRFNDIVANKEMLKEIGEFSVNRAKTEGKKGTPLNDDRRFPKLKDSTVKQRKYLSRYNDTDQFYKADKSSLNFTGQLWDSLQYKIINSKIRLFFYGRRDMYKTGKGSVAKRNSYNATNGALYKVLNKMGFTALGMDDKGEQRIRNIALKHIRKALKLTNNILK